MNVVIHIMPDVIQVAEDIHYQLHVKLYFPFFILLMLINNNMTHFTAQATSRKLPSAAGPKEM